MSIENISKNYESILKLAKEKYSKESYSKNLETKYNFDFNQKNLFRALKQEKINHISKIKVQKNFLSTTAKKHPKYNYSNRRVERDELAMKINFIPFPIPMDGSSQMDFISNKIPQKDEKSIIHLKNALVIKKNNNQVKNKLNFLDYYESSKKDINFSIGRVLIYSIFHFRYIEIKHNFDIHNKNNSIFTKGFLHLQYKKIPKLNNLPKQQIKKLECSKEIEIDYNIKEYTKRKLNLIFYNSNRDNCFSVKDEIKTSLLNRKIELIEFQINKRQLCQNLFDVNNSKFKSKLNDFTYIPYFVFNISLKKKIDSILVQFESLINSSKKSKLILTSSDTINTICILPSLIEIFNKMKISTIEREQNLIFKRLSHNMNSSYSYNSFIPLPKIENFNIKKRNYNTSLKTLSNENSIIHNFFIINPNSVGKIIQREGNFISFNYIKENVDIIFDVDICGLFLYSKDLNDEFDLNIYDELYQIINDSYIQYSFFYFIILDDEANKRNPNYDVTQVVKKLDKFLHTKFDELIYSGFLHLKFEIKTIKTANEVYQCIINVQHEIRGKMNKERCSLYTLDSYEEINKALYYILSKEKERSPIINEKYKNLNTFEGLILTAFESSKECFEQILSIIKKVSIYIYF